jgi:hypothetical protein
MIDGAAVVALLADLSNLQQYLISHFQSGANGKFPELDPLGGDIFGKIPWSNLESPVSNRADTLHGQEAHLSMPVARVSITLETSILQEFTCGKVRFLLTLEAADGDCHDLALQRSRIVFHGDAVNRIPPSTATVMLTEAVSRVKQ